MSAHAESLGRRLPRGWAHLALQFAIWIGFYAVYQVARGAADHSVEQAFANGQAIIDLQRALGSMVELPLQDLDDAREWMVTLGRKDARQRVASLLLLVARRCGAPGIEDANRIVFDLPLTRSDMADFLGLTIETVSRQISRLRNEGVVQIVNHRHVIVPSFSRLVAQAG